MKSQNRQSEREKAFFKLFCNSNNTSMAGTGVLELELVIRSLPFCQWGFVTQPKQPPAKRQKGLYDSDVDVTEHKKVATKRRFVISFGCHDN